MICTVLGARGFIGRQVAAVLHTQGFSPYCPDKVEDIGGRSLGIVFYCIGLTADFRERPLDAVEAHVCLLNRLLREANFDRLIYLSSTRVYAGLCGLVSEDADLIVNPNDISDLYNLSKLMGESACLHSGRDAVAARLSNVVGTDFDSGNFLFDLIREACDCGVIRLRSAAESVKDYILVSDAVNALVALSMHPHPKPIYNVASGRNLSNTDICEAIAEAADCRWEVLDGAPLLEFPRIDISRSRQELGLIPVDVLGQLENLVYQYRTRKV